MVCFECLDRAYICRIRLCARIYADGRRQMWNVSIVGGRDLMIARKGYRIVEDHER